MKKPSWLLPAVFLLCTASFCRTEGTDFPALAGPYLGQKPPGMTPEIFAPGIVSTAEFEFAGSFSADGKEYFFTRRPDYEGSENRIYYSQRLDHKWTRPVLAPFARDVFEFIPVIFPGNDKVIFYSERPKPPAAGLDGDLWVSERNEKGWNEPAYFLNPANRKYCMMVSSTQSGILYFSGLFNGRRGVFRSECHSGKYAEMEYLPEEINAIRPAHPFIAPDESFMIMDAQVTGMGKPELFVSFRRADGSWTRATNLGAEINATKTEFAGSVSPDGRYLFFHRRVNGNGDIYWVSAKILDKIRQEIIEKEVNE